MLTKCEQRLVTLFDAGGSVRQEPKKRAGRAGTRLPMEIGLCQKRNLATSSMLREPTLVPEILPTCPGPIALSGSENDG